MRKVVLALTLVPFLFCLPIPGEAQKVYRIGALIADDQFVPAFEGFKGKMMEIGYREGKSVIYDYHNAKGDDTVLERMVQKLLQGKPDLIVTSSTTATRPVARATQGSDLPVVFLSAGNPLQLVKSYASSGNNLTGVSSSAIDLTDKRMELLKELAPWIQKVVFLNNPKGLNYEHNLKAARAAAKKLGLRLVEVSATTREEMRRKVSDITRSLGDAIFIPPDVMVNGVNREIIQQSKKEKLPSVAVNEENVRRGVLAMYGSDNFALGQQGAMLVDKILKGARPKDLPIEQPFKLRLVINLKTARAIGLKIPKEVLLRADEVVD